MYDKVRKQLEKNLDKMHQERLARCVPVARKVVELIGQNVGEVAIGDLTEESSETYNGITLKILELFLAENVYWQDRDFVMQLALQPYSSAQRLVKASLDQATDVMYTAAIGQDVRDLRAQDVDKLLKLGDKIREERDKIEEPTDKSDS